MSVPFVYVNGTLNLILGGKSVQITPEHPSYGIIKKSLATATEADLLKLVDVQTSVQAYVEKESKGRAAVSNGVVYFDGKPVHNTLADRVLQFMKEGLPFKHLLLFMERAEKNPSYQSKTELFDFLQNKGLPITEDGCFLAYKAVRSDWLDKYTGTISNAIGKIVSVERNKVDDNRANECSKGLHCGALDYVYSYGGGDDHIIIVKVDPADAVSVPKDHSYMKLRTCRYEVIGEFTGELKSTLYTAKAEEVASPISDTNYDWSWNHQNEVNDDYDDEYDDYDDDDEDEDVCEDCVDCDQTDCPDHPDYEEENDDCSCHDCTAEVLRSQQALVRDRYGRFASKSGKTNKAKPKRDKRGRFA